MSAEAERAATLAQHEGFLDASSVVRSKDSGAAVDAGKVAKKPAKNRSQKEKKTNSGEKRKVRLILHTCMLSAFSYIHQYEMTIAGAVSTVLQSLWCMIATIPGISLSDFTCRSSLRKRSKGG